MANPLTLPVVVSWAEPVVSWVEPEVRKVRDAPAARVRVTELLSV